MKYRKLFLLLTTITLFNQITFAKTTDGSEIINSYISQHEQKQAIKKINDSQKIRKTEYSKKDIITLNQFLEQEDYEQFYFYFSRIDVPENIKFDYLNTKTQEGHIPLYWLLAETNSILGKTENSHMWLYTAIIMTEQDARKCRDTSSTNAVNVLLSSFNLTKEYVSLTPQHTLPGIAKSIFFIENLKNRINPKWACHYGNNPQLPALIFEDNFEKINNNVLIKFKKNFQN